MTVHFIRFLTLSNTPLKVGANEHLDIGGHWADYGFHIERLLLIKLEQK